MNINVKLPEPIKLQGSYESISLLVGPGMDWVTIDGAGNVTVKQNGGDGITYTVNVLDLGRAVRSEAKLLEQPEK